MASPHFKYLSKQLAHLRKDDYLFDAELITMQSPVQLHKVILWLFSSHLRESKVHERCKWDVLASGYNTADVENLVELLYDAETKAGDKVMELVKSLHLDLCVDQRIRKKKVPKGESVKDIVNLELKYLRDLVFEMEVPKLLNEPKPCSDVIIRVGTKLFHCHKVILAALSSYFRVMFSSGMKEEKEEVINILGIESDIFSLILNYMYTGRNPVKVSTAQDLLSSACYLQMESLQNVCEEFLISNLDINNCVDILNLATTYSCTSLIEAARKFIIENFAYINRLKLIRNLKLQDVEIVLKDDNLNVDDEKDVLKFTVDWVSTHKQHESLGQLLKLLRLGCVDQLYLEEVMKNNTCLKATGCVQIIQDHLKDRSADGDSAVSNPRKESTFVVLKQSSVESGVDVACYSLLQKKWFLLESNTKSAGGTGFGACSTEDSIYITGGSASPSSFYMFSLAENKWTKLADMQEGRHSHGTGYVDNAVFVLGGTDIGANTFSVVQSIEKHDLKQGEWKTVGEMAIPTYDSAFATIKTRIYVFGGAIGTIPGVYIKDIQCFDTITTTCTRLYHNLPFTLCLAVACSSNRDIYISCVNGKLIHYNEDSVPTVIDTKGSQVMGYATVFHDNSIYTMGGYSTTGETDTVQRFDLQTKKQVKLSQLKLPFKKQRNQYFACKAHVSRKFLKTGYMTVEQTIRTGESPR